MRTQALVLTFLLGIVATLATVVMINSISTFDRLADTLVALEELSIEMGRNGSMSGGVERPITQPSLGGWGESASASASAVAHVASSDSFGNGRVGGYASSAQVSGYGSVRSGGGWSSGASQISSGGYATSGN